MNNRRVSAGLGINEKLILKMDPTLEELLASLAQRFLPLCLPVSCRYAAPVPEVSLPMQISKSMARMRVCVCARLGVKGGCQIELTRCSSPTLMFAASLQHNNTVSPRRKYIRNTKYRFIIREGFFFYSHMCTETKTNCSNAS